MDNIQHSQHGNQEEQDNPSAGGAAIAKVAGMTLLFLSNANFFSHGNPSAMS
jgi:hypothetical protein